MKKLNLTATIMMVVSLGVMAVGSSAVDITIKSEKIEISRRMPVNPLLKQDMVSRSSSMLKRLTTRRA